VSPEERQLLELTARSLLKLERDILARVTGIETVLHALFVTKGNTTLALARLRIQADLLRLKGTPSSFLSSFLEQADAKAVHSQHVVSSGDSNGSQQTDRRQRT
jgi:hypothetical protein